MPGEMKTRIVLEGEKEFSRAMSDAARQIKVLSAEERLAQAQFKATGDAQAHAAEQARILREQIALQKQAVDAAERAVQQLTQQGVQPNDAAMTKWRTKLTNARTTLVQLQTRLDGIEGDLKDDTREFGRASDAAGQYGDEVRKIGGTINTQAAIDSIGRITSAIEGTVRMAARATRAVVSIAKDAGKWADDTKTAADQMGIDPETYQSWEYAGTFIDTEMTDISKSWQDIQKRIGDGNNEFAVSLDRMGIATRDASGKMRTTNDIFWDTIDYLHGIDDESTRAAEATRIFGNDWRKINPLIMAGSGAFKDLAKEGLGVATVSNEEVDALGSMNDQIEKTEAQFQKLKMDALAKLAPSFERIAKALGDAITSLDEFVQSDEGRAALESLGTALESIITKFTETDENGESGFQKLLEKAAGAIDTLKKGLVWVSEHSQEVVTALGLLAGGFALLKVSSAVLTFMQLLNTTPLNKITAALGGGTGTSTGTGTGTGTPTAAPGAGAAAAAAGGTAGLKFFGGGPTGILSGLALFNAWKALGLDPIGDSFDRNREKYGHAVLTKEERELETAELYGSVGMRYTLRENMAERQGKLFDMAEYGLSEKPGQGFLGMFSGPDKGTVNATIKWFQGQALEKVLDPELLDRVMSADTVNGDNVDLLKDIRLSLRHMDPAVFADTGEEATAAGEAIGDGLKTGMESKSGDVTAAAGSLAGIPLNVIRTVMEIHSPSRAMAALGQMAGMGFAEGLASSAGAVAAAAANLGAIASRIPMPSYAGGAGAFGAGAMAGASFSSSFYVDKYIQNTSEDARALAQRVQDVNSWTRAGFGHRG